MHHGINISAFIKPTIILTQFNNAATLSFGSMISLLGPLLLKVFAKFRLKLPTMDINPLFDVIRENTASETFQKITYSEEFQKSIAPKQLRRIDRCYDLKKLVASEEFTENVNSGEFSENVDFGEFSESTTSDKFSEDIVFEELQVRGAANLRRCPSCVFDFDNVNKVENADSEKYRESVDSEEVRKSVDSEQIKKGADSEKNSESAVSQEFRASTSADEAVKQCNENLDSQILTCQNLNQQYSTVIKRNSTITQMMGKLFVVLSALPEETEEENN